MARQLFGAYAKKRPELPGTADNAVTVKGCAARFNASYGNTQEPQTGNQKVGVRIPSAAAVQPARTSHPTTSPLPPGRCAASSNPSAPTRLTMAMSYGGGPSGDDPAGFPECAGLTTIRRSCARRSRKCLGCLAADCARGAGTLGVIGAKTPVPDKFLR